MTPRTARTAIALTVALVWLALPLAHAGADTASYRLAQLKPGFDRVAAEFIKGEPNTLTEVIINIITVVLSFIAVVAVGAIVVGGFMYVTAFGSEEKASRAKSAILYALIGLFVVLAAAIIVNVILFIF